MNTYVYVDAFNLYYGAIRKTPYKWLDLNALCKKLLPNDNILKIRYFTALVTPWPSDPHQPERQKLYIRALKTLPNIEVHFGRFLTNKVEKLMVGKRQKVWVWDTEEKGSDVNLATYLIHDGYRNLYDAAVVVSNDSDLTEAIKIARCELNKKVGVINPHRKVSYHLKKEADFLKHIRQGVLADSQFPDEMSDSDGAFHKPVSW